MINSYSQSFLSENNKGEGRGLKREQGGEGLFERGGWLEDLRYSINFLLTDYSQIFVSILTLHFISYSCHIAIFYSQNGVEQECGTTAMSTTTSTRKEKKERKAKKKQYTFLFYVLTCSTHFCKISLPSPHNNGVKMPNFNFCGGCKQTTTNFVFFSWTRYKSFRVHYRKNCQHSHELNE